MNLEIEKHFLDSVKATSGAVVMYGMGEVETKFSDDGKTMTINVIFAIADYTFVSATSESQGIYTTTDEMASSQLGKYIGFDCKENRLYSGERALDNSPLKEKENPSSVWNGKTYAFTPAI